MGKQGGGPGMVVTNISWGLQVHNVYTVEFCSGENLGGARLVGGGLLPTEHPFDLTVAMTL